MEIRFVKAPGRRDRCWVTHSDGAQRDWEFPSYGDALPHDLVHFVVESTFGLQRGLWGLVATGIDLARINAASNRSGGDLETKYGADMGPLDDLLLAETLAAHAWAAATPEDVVAACARAGVRAPVVDEARCVEVRGALDTLLTRWRALGEKGTLVLHWPPAH